MKCRDLLAKCPNIHWHNVSVGSIELSQRVPAECHAAGAWYTQERVQLNNCIVPSWHWFDPCWFCTVASPCMFVSIERIHLKICAWYWNSLPCTNSNTLRAMRLGVSHPRNVRLRGGKFEWTLQADVTPFRAEISVSIFPNARFLKLQDTSAYINARKGYLYNERHVDVSTQHADKHVHPNPREILPTNHLLSLFSYWVVTKSKRVLQRVKGRRGANMCWNTWRQLSALSTVVGKCSTRRLNVQHLLEILKLKMVSQE